MIIDSSSRFVFLVDVSNEESCHGRICVAFKSETGRRQAERTETNPITQIERWVACAPLSTFSIQFVDAEHLIEAATILGTSDPDALALFIESANNSSLKTGDPSFAKLKLSMTLSSAYLVQSWSLSRRR